MSTKFKIALMLLSRKKATKIMLIETQLQIKVDEKILEKLDNFLKFYFQNCRQNFLFLFFMYHFWNQKIQFEVYFFLELLLSKKMILSL